MAAGGSPAVDKVAKSGPQVAHVPDTEPLLSPAGSPTSQFEDAGFDQVGGGSGISPAHRADGKSSPSFTAQASPRGHMEISPASVKGNAPVRSAGRKTTEADRRPLSTAGS